MKSRHEVAALVLDSHELVGDGGFLKLRRLHLRNRRTDGTFSAPYISDSVARPYGQDAVIVVIYARTPRGIDVLLREQLRPPITLGRDHTRAPLPEPAPGLFVIELVAGILEESDKGEPGLRTRAAAETLEEAGFTVDPATVTILGAGLLSSPGAMVEKFYFTAVEVDPKTQTPPPSDGSPMEEGARTWWVSLDEALAACMRGEVSDLKTELGLRRLADRVRSKKL